MLCDLRNGLGADECASASCLDVGKERDDEETLFWGVEEMDEEVTVDVPSLQFIARDSLALSIGCTEIDDPTILPCTTPTGDAVFSAQQIADGIPRFRSEIRGVELVVGGHVGTFCVPCRFVSR